MELVEGGNLSERIHAPHRPRLHLLEVLQVRVCGGGGLASHMCEPEALHRAFMFAWLSPVLDMG